MIEIDKQALSLNFKIIIDKIDTLEEKINKFEASICKMEELEKQMNRLQKQNLLFSNYLIKKEILNESEKKTKIEIKPENEFHLKSEYVWNKKDDLQKLRQPNKLFKNLIDSNTDSDSMNSYDSPIDNY